MVINQQFNLQNVITQFTDPDLIGRITEKFDLFFTHMNLIHKFVFSKYHTFLADVQSFKSSLLKFILEAQAHLSGLKKNMASDGFKNASEEKQLKFIESRLNKIDKQLLFNYLGECQKLIKTSLSLHDEYGTTLFKVKYIFGNMLGFTLIGAAVGFSLGLVLPFCSIAEAAAGVVVGAIGGLVYASYELIFKWEERMEQVQKIRDNLIRIHDALVDVEKQICITSKAVVEAQMEVNEKVNGGTSLLDVAALRDYVFTTYDQFIQLERTLLNVKIGHEET